jgi:hypothetical protein
MKKIILAVLMFVLIASIGGMGGSAFAEDTPKEVLGWDVTMPFKTGVTAFYFPSDSTFAGGLNTTVLSVRNNNPVNPTLSKITFDLDATVAQEFNENNDTLYGLGFKVNYAQNITSKSGVMFEPSIGVTALRNLKGINTFADVCRDYRFAIYGNVVLYKFR